MIDFEYNIPVVGDSVLRVLPQPEPDASVIKRLEQLLEKAKVGEVTAFCAAVNHKGGGVSTWRAGRSKLSEMLWSLERSKLRLMGFVEDCDLDMDLSGT